MAGDGGRVTVRGLREIGEPRVTHEGLREVGMGTGACALELGPSVFAETPNSARQPSSNQPQHGACPRARMFGTKELMREMTNYRAGVRMRRTHRRRHCRQGANAVRWPPVTESTSKQRDKPHKSFCEPIKMPTSNIERRTPPYAINPLNKKNMAIYFYLVNMSPRGRPAPQKHRHHPRKTTTTHYFYRLQ